MAKPEERKKPITLIFKNRQAFRDYEITETAEAGLVLSGTEVKSLRRNDCDLSDAWVKIRDGHVTLENAYIGIYSEGNRENHETKRPRVLLLHRREVLKWEAALSRRGLACIPLSIYFKGSWAKVEIGLGKGKKKFDKRQDLKSKEAKREVDTERARRR